MHHLALDGSAVVARLASLSAMLVYKDLAPGYRIRPPTEKELEMTVSKEVRATRDYETAFLKGAPTCCFALSTRSLSPASHGAQRIKAFCSCCCLPPAAPTVLLTLQPRKAARVLLTSARR